MLKKYKVHFLSVFILLLISLSSLFWFGDHDIILGDDLNLLFKAEGVSEYFNIISWRGAFVGADADKFTFLFPLGFLIKIWSLLNLPFSVFIFQRLLVVFWLFSAAFSFYIFTLVCFKEFELHTRLILSIMYIFNLYTMVLMLSMGFLIFQYCFFPLILAIFIKGLTEKNKLFIFIVPVVWLFTMTPGYGSLQYVITNWFFILLFVPFFILKKVSFERIKWAVTYTISIILLWSILNLFWIAPVYLSLEDEVASHSMIGVESEELFKSNSVPLFQSLTFSGYPPFLKGWKEVKYYPWFEGYNNSFLIFVCSFIIVLLAFGSILNKINNYIIFYLFFMLLIALFFVKGVFPPFGELTTGLFSEYNLFFIFRVLYHRFMQYIIFPMLVLFGITFNSFFVSQKPSTKLILLFFLFFFSFILTYPLWNGELFENNEPFRSRLINFPEYYDELNTYLDKDQNDFNVISIPTPLSAKWAENFSENSYYFGIYPPILMSTKRFFIANSNLTYTIESKILTSQNILSDFNIKYVLLHENVNWYIIKNHQWWAFNDVSKYQFFENISYLQKVKVFGPINVYENKNWKPAHLLCFINESSDEEVLCEVSQFNKLESSYYTFKLSYPDPSKPPFIVFNEKYDKKWQLYTDFGEIITPEEYQGRMLFNIPKNTHSFSLKHSTQEVFYFGFYISLITLILCLFILVKNILKSNQ